MIITERVGILTLGERIKSYRVAQGLSQAQLSGICGIPASQISRIESDEVPGISAWRLAKIAEALGVTTSHLLGEVPFLADWPRGK